MGNDVLCGSGAARHFGKAPKGLLPQGTVNQKSRNHDIARSRRNRIIRRPAECDGISIIIHCDRVESRADLGVGSRRDHRRGDPAREIGRIRGDSLTAEVKVERAPIDIQGDSAVLRRSLAEGPSVPGAV